MTREEYDFCQMLVEKFDYNILVTNVMGDEQFWLLRGSFNPKGFHQPYHEMIDGVELTDIIKNRSFNSAGSQLNLERLIVNQPKVSLKFGSDKFVFIYKVNFGV